MIKSTVIITVHIDLFAICMAFGLGKRQVDRNYFSRLSIALVVKYIATEIAVVVTVIAVAVTHLATEFAVVFTQLAAGASRKVDGLD